MNTFILFWVLEYAVSFAWQSPTSPVLPICTRLPANSYTPWNPPPMCHSTKKDLTSSSLGWVLLFAPRVLITPYYLFMFYSFVDCELQGLKGQNTCEFMLSNPKKYFLALISFVNAAAFNRVTQASLTLCNGNVGPSLVATCCAMQRGTLASRWQEISMADWELSVAWTMGTMET